MKLNGFQKVMLAVAVFCFGGFLFCYLNRVPLGVLSFGTCMGVAFLVILAWDGVSSSDSGEEEENISEDEYREPVEHVDNLIDQLAERRVLLDEANEKLEKSEAELERASESLLAVEESEKLARSEVKAQEQLNEKLKSYIRELEGKVSELEGREENRGESILPQAAANDPVVLSVVDVMNDAVKEFESAANRSGVKLKVVAPDGPLMVKADVIMLETLFRNVIDNAIKYMKRQGTLQVTISEIGEELFIVMKDNGEGLSESETEHIFELNYQGSNRISGNGLGLAQARAIVQYYGGMIYARSRQGNGMGVYIHLPSESSSDSSRGE